MVFERKNKAKLTLLTIVLLAFFSMTSSHALEMPFPTRDKPFAVTDSGVEVPHEYGGLVKWMDNDRVIFSAYRKDVPRSNVPEGLHIVIWDVAQGKVTHYADGKLRCYSDGNIAYQTEATKFVSRGVAIEKGKTGELGKELLIEAGAADPLWLINPYSCKSYDSLGFTSRDKIVRPDPLMHILRLREDHGYLDLYTKGQQVIEKEPNGRVTIRQVTRLPFVPMNKYHIKYYRTGEKEPIDLNSVRRGISKPVFSKYANAYVLDQLISGKGSGSAMLKLPDGERSSVRLLSPEGKIETLTYPDSLFQITSATEINVSRAGLLIVASAGERFNPRSKTTGLFLARSEKVVKLVNESVNSLDVSPDGCKVVFRQGILNGGWMPIEGHPFTIKMINVCDSTHE